MLRPGTHGTVVGDDVVVGAGVVEVAIVVTADVVVVEQLPGVQHPQHTS